MAGLPGRAVVVLALCLAPLGCVVWPEGAGPRASSMPLAEALERRNRCEVVLIDVRSRQAYAEGHVPGALSITSSEIEGRASEIRRMGRIPILYCG
jgi:hypothetical protein